MYTSTTAYTCVLYPQFLPTLSEKSKASEFIFQAEGVNVKNAGGQEWLWTAETGFCADS
jgi:hypothetical protein